MVFSRNLICILLSWVPCEINLRRGSSLDYEVDLDAGPQRQGGHSDGGAGGKGLAEMPGVDGVHGREVTDAREIHAGTHHIVETPAGCLEQSREVLEDA